MFINFKTFLSCGLASHELLILQAIYQRDYWFLEDKMGYVLNLEDRGFISRVKPTKKSQPEWEIIRLSDKGVDLVKEIDVPEVVENDKIFLDWISDYYLKKGKEIGSKNKCLKYIACLRAYSNLSHRHLAELLKTFLLDEENMKYNYKLEYALFKPENAYSKKFNLDDSRIYQYYLKFEDYFSKRFEDIDRKELEKRREINDQ